jgi:tellurite methyltransferase
MEPSTHPITASASFGSRAADEFLAASGAWPPRAWLVDVVDRLERVLALTDSSDPPLPRHAVDLGCGAGNETLELLRRGWSVHAIDAHAPCLESTRRRAEEAGVAAGLTLELAAFEHLRLPARTYTLVHAGFSLPFCRADAFEGLWRQVTDATLPRGFFAGQFFGAREPLILQAEPGSVTSHSPESIERLLGVGGEPSWNATQIHEVDRPGRGARGEPKHWHLFHVVLERESAPP